MNNVRRIVKNSTASLIARLSTPVSSFVLVFFIARILHASGLGQYSIALALLFIFQSIASLGFPYLVTREVAKEHSKAAQYLTNASVIGLIISFLTAGLMCGTVHLISDDVTTIQATYILSVSLVPYALTIVCQSICKGFERLEYITIPMVIGNGLKMILGIVVLLNGYGLNILMMVILAHQFIVFFISLYFTIICIRAQKQKNKRINWAFLKSIIMATPVFALIMIVSTMRLNMDMLIINKLMGETEVGFYSAAIKIVNMGLNGIVCYIIAVQPTLFRSCKTDPDGFKNLCTQSVRYFFIIILPLIVGTMVLSDKFILLIYADKFLPSAWLLCILIWLMLLTGFNQILANALIASDRQQVNLKANLIGLFSSVSLNLLLIPLVGVTGAALTAIIAALATFLFQNLFVNRHIVRIRYFGMALKPILASAVMGVVVFFIKSTSLICVIPVGVVVYMLSLLFLKTFNDYDKKLLQKLVKGQNEKERKRLKARLQINTSEKGESDLCALR